MTRAAPFGFNKVVFLSHVVGTTGPVLPGDGVRADPLAALETDHGRRTQAQAGDLACLSDDTEGKDARQRLFTICM